jgi:glycosyltransferase involved in cell wall biosynthesis
MAIILLVGPRPHAIGGVTSHLRLLCASALAQRHQFVHFAVGGEGLRESAARKLLRVLGAPFAFAVLLHRSRAALVHLNPSMDRSFWRDLPLLLAARAMRRPVTLQIHGGQLPEFFCADIPGARRLVRAALRLADRVVVLAGVEYTAFGRIVDDATLRLIPNAIDPAPYAGDKPDRYDGVRPMRAVYLGRIVRSKGLFDACDAVAAARAAGARVEFLIAGAGPDSRILQEHIDALGVAHAVRLVGPLQGAAKEQFLLAADVLLFPTFHPEGLPYALLEAMAAATPAITTAVGAIPDVIKDGMDGLLVPMHDADAAAAAMLALAAAPARLHALAQAARARILDAYSLSRLERDFAALYAELLAAGRGPTPLVRGAAPARERPGSAGAPPLTCNQPAAPPCRA